jgi:hypothetical protein
MMSEQGLVGFNRFRDSVWVFGSILLIEPSEVEISGSQPRRELDGFTKTGLGGSVAGRLCFDDAEEVVQIGFAGRAFQSSMHLREGFGDFTLVDEFLNLSQRATQIRITLSERSTCQAG